MVKVGDLYRCKMSGAIYKVVRIWDDGQVEDLVIYVDEASLNPYYGGSVGTVDIVNIEWYSENAVKVSSFKQQLKELL